MKKIAATLIGLISLIVTARADVTIVQKVEGASPSLGQMTIKIKGDKSRIEATPQMATIIDAKTGEILNLMHDQKMVMRISSEQARVAAKMAGEMSGLKEGTPKMKLTPTGKTQRIGEHDTQQYVSELPNFKATYWIATKYPNGPAILKELQAMQPQSWAGTNMGMPDYRDLPGIPLKTVVSTGGQEYTSTVSSISLNPLSETEFAVPQGYKESSLPDIFGRDTSDPKKPVGPDTKPAGVPGGAVTPSATP